jgi:hypothetical protein
MARNEVLSDHPPSKIITLHPAIPQVLLDSAPNFPSQAFVVLFLLSSVRFISGNLQASWQQLLVSLAPGNSAQRRNVFALPGQTMLLELLPSASIMMAAERIIASSSHSTTGIIILDIKSNLWLHPLSSHHHAITSIRTTFDKSQNNFKQIFS